MPVVYRLSLGADVRIRDGRLTRLVIGRRRVELLKICGYRVKQRSRNFVPVAISFEFP